MIGRFYLIVTLSIFVEKCCKSIKRNSALKKVCFTRAFTYSRWLGGTQFKYSKSSWYTKFINIWA